MKSVHISDVKYMLPADRIITKISSCGRKAKLRLNLDHIKDLNWQLTNDGNIKSNICAFNN